VLRYRLISGFSIAGVLIAAALHLPSWGAWIVLLAIATVAIREFYGLLDRVQIPVYRMYGTLFGAALISTTFFTIGPAPEQVARAYRWEGVVLMVMVIAVFIRQFPQKHNDRPIETIACTHFGVLYVPFLFNFFTKLLFAWDVRGLTDPIGDTGLRLLCYAVILAKVPDIGAYFAGRCFGRHKMWPRISPAKTWEGLCGGLLAGVAGSVGYCAALHGNLGALHLGYGDAVILGLALPPLSVTGDLFESLLKRSAGAKDSGTLFPGMGGILDVLDSLLFVGPALYAYCVLFLDPGIVRG
jgi:phosphatidate cytidylyltransferase